MKKIILALGLAASFTASAGGYTPAPAPVATMEASAWHVGIGMGYTNYRDMYSNNDANTVLGRLSIAKDTMRYNSVTFGLEVGMQTGNQSRLALTTEQSFDLGDVAVQTTIKPMVDLLATVSSNINSSAATFIKGGIAYRQMNFDRDTMNTLNKVSGEVQAGFSVKVSETASLSLAYQGIFGGNVNLVTNNPTTTLGGGSGTAENIPTQQGVLLTLSMTA